MDIDDLISQFLAMGCEGKKEKKKQEMTVEQALWVKLFNHYKLPVLEEKIESVDEGKELFEQAIYAKTQKETVMKAISEEDVIIDVVRDVMVDKLLIILENQGLNVDEWLSESDNVTDELKALLGEYKIGDKSSKYKMWAKDVYVQSLEDEWQIEIHSFVSNNPTMQIETFFTLSDAQLEGFLYDAYSCYLLKEL